MKRLRSQIVSGVLVLSILATMMPMSAFATGSGELPAEAESLVLEEFLQQDSAEDKVQSSGGTGTDSPYVLSETEVAYPAEGGNLYFDTATGVITGCDKEVTKAVIPDTIEEVSVISVGNSAFRDCNNLTAITLPDSVTSIGEYAFYGCDSLPSVNIPDSVTSIGDRAFASSGLVSVIIPDSVASIGTYVFAHCEDLSCATIGDGLSSIANRMFYSCDNLTSVTIGAGVTYFERFEDCFNLKEINVVSQNSAFCSLDGVLFNKEMTTIIEYPDGRQGGYTIPNGVLTVGYQSFSSCFGLTSVIIPDSVTSIGRDAFRFCNSLTNMTIPDSVISIGEDAFRSCTSLISVEIPDSVTSIGDRVFYSCTSLTSVEIPDSVTSIGESAFRSCNGLTDMIIPNSVISIGEDAFRSCTSLTSMEIPDSVTSIGERVFYSCTGLTSVEISDSVTSIGEGAFYFCNSLVSVTMGNDVTFIGRNAFFDCDSLANIYYGGSEDKWDAIWIESGNWYLTSATIHYNSTGPDDPGIGEKSHYLVDVFTSYDAERKQAVFGVNPDIYTYQMTDKTDMSFLDHLDKLLGQCVLVHYISGKYGESDYLTRYILSITPANIQTGMVEAITESSVTINGKTYNADFEGWVGLDSYIEQTVVCYFNNDIAVDIKVLEKKAGVLSAGSITTVTIDDVHYTAIFKGIPPFLSAPDLWFGNSINYWITDNIVYQVELPDYTSTYYKRLDRIDGKKAYFHDGSQYEIAKDTSVDANMIGRWVEIGLITSAETGTNLVDIQLLKPKMSIKVEMAEKRNIRLEDNRYSYDGKNPVPSSQFEIVYRIIVSNTIPHDSEKDLKLMKSDPALTITFENLEVTPPENFNAGWTGSGEIPNVPGITLSPGETKEVKGYVRPGMFFFVDDNDVSVTKDIRINLQTTAGEYSDETSFTILNLDYKPPKPQKDVFNSATVKALGKKAANELDALYNGSSSGIVLDINTMSQIFGIKGEKLELFEKELLTEVIMSSAPEDSLSQQISDSLMSDVFGDFKSPVSGKSYDIPLKYVVETPNYGILTVKFNSRVTSFTVNQSRYALIAAVTYEVLQQDNSNGGRPIPETLKEGTLGGISYSDVKGFADATYAFAKEALKEAYDDAWGNSANQVASFLFGDTVKYILEECDTSFSKVLWNIVIWPTENIKIACPVDLFIYDKDGNLCGSIENNTVTQTNPQIQLSVEGDTKYVNGLKDSYTVEYKATDNGDMDIVIVEFSGYESPLRTITFQSVPLAKDGTYTQNIIGEVFTTSENYKLTSNSGEEVVPDDEVVFVDFESDETTTDPDPGDGDGDNSNGESEDGSSDPTYSITTEDTNGGTITINPEMASKGKTVTITAAPDDGFALKTLSVTDKNGNKIELTKQTETSYTFKMPASKVTVSATFTEIVVEPEPIVLPFNDISQSAWYYGAVEYVYSTDMMQGTSATTFSPEVEMSRGMIATVLYRLANTPALTDNISFSDVGGNEWYTDAIQWAAENSIMSGYGNNRFGPMDSVTREQLAVILYNYTTSEGISVEAAGDLSVFHDAEDTSDWAEEAISWAVGVGLLSGKGNGILDPTGTATRAEVAQILMNYCTKVV